MVDQDPTLKDINFSNPLGESRNVNPETDRGVEALSRTFKGIFTNLSDGRIRRFVNALPELTPEQEDHLRVLEGRVDRELTGPQSPQPDNPTP